MEVLGPLQARIQYKIIIPFLLLALLVGLASASVALLVITGSAQDRLRNQLAQVARDASDQVVLVERANLAFLREMSFAQANPATGAPAVADAIRANDVDGLALALDPYFRVSADRGVHVDRLIVFDQRGQSLLDWERPGDNPDERKEYAASDLSSIWFVESIIHGQSDSIGDKYAGLIDLSGNRYLYTVAPIEHNGTVIGGLVAAIELRSLLHELNSQIQAAIVTIYEPTKGNAFLTSSEAIESISELQIRTSVLPLVRELTTNRQQQGVIDIVQINGRDYQVAYAPLQIRESIIGIVSFALTNDYVTGPWADVRTPLLVLTAFLLAGIMLLGIMVARQITRPLQNLVDTAQAVIAGDLARRSRVESKDEVGLLANSFNAMTGHLLTMYGTVQDESSQRAAIVESIADGIVVLELDRTIRLMNPAMRTMLNLAEHDPPPLRFGDIPLKTLDEAALSYGATRAPDLFQLGERTIRVTAAPIHSHEGNTTGYVCVFQDLSAEVAVDRAKTNFIATISHELRTPLTVIGGNADLLLSGLIGSLTPEQRDLVEAIRRYTTTTTGLINNMITVAGLDAESIPFEIEPFDLATLVDDAVMVKRRTFKLKQLNLLIELPPDLPLVHGDASQVRIVLHQLLDNAVRYTDHGHVVLRAVREEQVVRVEVEDTGHGIEPALREQLFTRFMRGSEGINSEERGIGLGLAIARELLEHQHGQIWLAHTSEHGSTFCFTLPHNNEPVQIIEQSIPRTA